MSLISFRNVAKAFAAATILDRVSFDLPYRGKVGLVGENGCGKSTVLKLITGAIEPDSGEVSVAGSARIWHVPQMPELSSELTAYEEVLTSRPGLAEIRHRMLASEERLSETGGSEVYADAVAEFSEAGGYRFENEAAEALDALGLDEAQTRLPVGRLSGGEQARVALAKALLADPSVLLLDEPDNHLDIDGIVWLESMLKRYRGAMILVTHDRELLDRVVESIVEIEDGKATHERGGFAEFLERKRDRIEFQKRQYLEQQRRVRKLQEAVSRIDGQARGIEQGTKNDHLRRRAKIVARRATVLKRRIERQLEGEQRIEKPREERDRIRVGLAARRQHERTVLRLEGVTKSLGGRTLFANVGLELSRGRRIAVVGPNGGGKTTLMEVALGIQSADVGSVWMSPAASAFYCDQHLGGLPQAMSVYETIVKHTDLTHTQIHYLLAQLLFKGEAVHKPVDGLSGGERTRLVLALLMNTRADLLMLDEPTNHLDLPSIEVLQEALQTFDGAVLFISHDRRFVRAVATDVFELSETGLLRRLSRSGLYR